MRHFILVATTNDFLANQLELFLGGECNLRHVKNRNDFLDLALKEEPAICIIDEEFPDSNGYDLCGKIKGEYNKEQVICMYLASNPAQYDQGRANLVMLDEFVIKPLEERAFKEKINRLLEGKSGSGSGSNPIGIDVDYVNSRVLDVEIPLEEQGGEDFIESSESQYRHDIPNVDVGRFRALNPETSEDEVLQEKNENAIYHGVDENDEGPTGDDDEPEDEIPFIASPNIDMLPDFDKSGAENTDNKSPQYSDPVAQFLNGAVTVDEEKHEEASESNTVSENGQSQEKEIMDEVDAVLSDKDLLELARSMIAQRIGTISDDDIERIITETVESKLSTALSAMSPKIHQAIRKAVSNELKKHLASEVESAVSKVNDKGDREI